MKDKNPEQKTALAEEERNGTPREAQIEHETLISTPASIPGTSGNKERRFRQTALPAHFIERRKHPRIGTEQPLPSTPPCIDDYAAIIGKPELDEIRFLARHLRGKTVKMVNSTAVGGGVAEI